MWKSHRESILNNLYTALQYMQKIRANRRQIVLVQMWLDEHENNRISRA